jgi:hypothetical protein
MTAIFNHRRRTLLRGASTAGALLARSACTQTRPAVAPTGDPWDQAPVLLGPVASSFNGAPATPIRFSCYQPIVTMGPVAANYNGPGKPQVLPVSNVTISDCDFGTPVHAAAPAYLYNVKGLLLRNVKINGKLLNGILSP